MDTCSDHDDGHNDTTTERRAELRSLRPRPHLSDYRCPFPYWQDRLTVLDGTAPGMSIRGLSLSIASFGLNVARIA